VKPDYKYQHNIFVNMGDEPLKVRTSGGEQRTVEPMSAVHIKPGEVVTQLKVPSENFRFRKFNG
jgi:hypothetical protein